MESCILTMASIAAMHAFMAPPACDFQSDPVNKMCMRSLAPAPQPPMPIYICTRPDGTTYTRVGDTPVAAPLP